MTTRRTLGLGLGLATLTVVGALALATLVPTPHLRRTAQPGSSGPLGQQLTGFFRTIPIALPGGDEASMPTGLACVGSTCILDTSTTTGASTLWSSSNASLTFATRTSLPSATLVAQVACQTATTCYAIAEPVSTRGSSQLLELSEPQGTISHVNVAPSYEPSTIGCLPSGPCWTTGTRGGSTTGYVRQTPSAGWAPLHLPSLGANTRDAITCASPSLCIDITTVQGQMASSSGAVLGSLTQGFTRTLAAPNVANIESTACDLSTCWFAEDPLREGSAIALSRLSAGGQATIRLEVPPSSELMQLACSAHSCLALVAVKAKTNIHFYLLGSHPAALVAPKGLSLDGPSLLCDLGATDCLASLATGVPGEGALVHIAAFGGKVVLGAPVTLGVQAQLDPFPNLLTSCLPSECFEVVEGTGINLLGLDPLSRTPAQITAVRDPAVGDALLAPIALSCPTTSSCDLVARLGASGPDVLLEIAPGTGTLHASPLPPSASAEDLACASQARCVIAVSGISHHHGFEVLVTHNGGATFEAGTVTNAMNDLSVLAVACPGPSQCVALAQHDFAIGDGTLRPAIATSTDGGRTWRLVPLVGRQPIALLDMAATGLSCVGSHCVGILTANNPGGLNGSTTLVLTGTASGTSFAVHTVPFHAPRLSVPINDALACTSNGCLATVTFSEPPAPPVTYASTITLLGIARSIRLLTPPAPAGLAASAHAFLGTTSTQAEWLVPDQH